MISSEIVRKYAACAGFSLCGIAPVRPLVEQAARLGRWLADDYDSGLGYMRRNIEKRLDPGVLFDGAKSVIVCAAAYKNQSWDQRSSPNPKISSYALGTDYHVTLKRMLHEVLDRITGDYPRVRGRCFTDTAPILEKSWAIEAGLGWRGRNSLVVTPEYGSFVFLGEIVIDAPVDRYDAPYSGMGCGKCTACIDSCPNSAIRTPYIIDTGKCISRLTAEKLPEGYSLSGAATHGWIYGCDICQSVCPYNARAPLAALPDFRPQFDPVTKGREFWQSLDREAFGRIFDHTPVARIGWEKIKKRTEAFFATNGETFEK